MDLITAIKALAAHLSRVCGFDTLDAFPRGHVHAHTRWNGAYFDIASDRKPEQIEAALCEAISNTPLVFAYISNPTPRMQRALLAVISTRVRRSCGNPGELVALLIAAYRSAHTQDAVPGLRRAIDACADGDAQERVRSVLAYLAQMPSAFDIIEAQS